MTRLFALLVLLVVLFAAAPLRAQEEDSAQRFDLASLGFSDVRSTSVLNFDIEYRPAEEPWARDIIARANAARAALNRATGEALLSRIRIVVTPDRQTFLRLVGDWAENSAAVAAPGQRVMVINGDVMRSGPPGNFGTTLLHELAHLFFGVKSPRPLPRWLDEGLAQAIAHEGNAEGVAALVWARWLGGLIPLRDLERSFPVQADRQRLAYQQSLSVVQYLVSEEYGGSLSRFIDTLTGREAEPEIERFWNPMTRDLLEARWQKSLGSGTNWLTLTLSSGLFWGGLALLTILAWLIIRRRSRALRSEWAEEERIYEALDEEERRIWGDDDEDLVYRDEYEWGSIEDWEDGGEGKRRR